MTRIAAITALVVLAAAAPAVAQDVVGAPQLDIGEAAALGGAVIRDGSTKIGMLEVSRVGDAITVKATFSRRPPGRRASLCLKVEGNRKCVHKGSKRGLKLTMDRTAAFTSALKATARSGDVLATVRL